MPNYAVFHVEPKLVYFYVIYYYGWMILSSVLALYWAQNSEHKRQLIWLTSGYASFIIPTTIANVINPTTVAGIPSIMCGFAVLMAVAIIAGVLPGQLPKAPSR
jgi:peptidoglycan/LPS O-acetylase OafA/YrhL